MFAGAGVGAVWAGVGALAGVSAAGQWPAASGPVTAYVQPARPNASWRLEAGGRELEVGGLEAGGRRREPGAH